MMDLVVFDTNVMISALIGSGAARRCLTLAKTAEIRPVYCDEMIAEFSEKLQFTFHYSVDDIRAVVYFIRSSTLHVNITGMLKAVDRDPDDDKFIEAAMVSGAKIILSSDHHLTDLGRYQDIQIMRPRDFLKGRYADSYLV